MGNHQSGASVNVNAKFFVSFLLAPNFPPFSEEVCCTACCCAKCDRQNCVNNRFVCRFDLISFCDWNHRLIFLKMFLHWKIIKKLLLVENIIAENRKNSYIFFQILNQSISPPPPPNKTPLTSPIKNRPGNCCFCKYPSITYVLIEHYLQGCFFYDTHDMCDKILKPYVIHIIQIINAEISN